MTLKPNLIMCIASIILSSGTSIASAQDATNNASFENSTAVLDTSVLFAIGAREAEQAIRGSFGWPTFQEGFVESVYFRFDPDGYARFSPSPRLDEDVFEIQCVQNGSACIAQKNGVEIGLTPEGRIQVRFDGITPNDSFFVSDRKTELPLPPTILEPLDARLETLLSSSSELIIKRELEVLQSISLVGFSAVTTYLRWVAQGQSPRVFPRGWPVPAQSGQLHSSGLTQPSEWETATNAPQVSKTTWHMQSRNPTNTQGFANAGFVRNGQADYQSQQYGQLQSEFQAMKDELATLRSGGGQTAPIHANQGWASQVDHGTVFGNEIQSVGQHSDIVAPNYSALQNNGVETELARTSDFANFANHFDNTNLRPQFGIQRENLTQNPEDMLLNRVMNLEAELETLRQLISRQQQYGAVASQSGQKPMFESNQLSTNQIQSSSGEERIKVLENLLLQRLGPTKPVTQPMPIILDDTDSQEKREQELVQEMLRKLDSNPPTIDANIQGDNSNATAPQSDEYVSLSDYLNRVLKNNGLNTDQ
ncbi:hypothetical protein BFP76_09195 [Amylibacter kogurei]|uniref:Uncharacterized protein n=1 Tax=Paramylibacter kogurei TaxID=1889778 RepID=A0A2G5K375_9RHOB|nr:hypothetical protein [Amylibacter kogurei]PIB23184.1 hypothetical protein BFP76_09195 [Amylibacter kogurei]